MATSSLSRRRPDETRQFRLGRASSGALPPGSSGLVRVAVLVVGHEVAPRGLVALPDRRVDHEPVGGATVPVLLARGCPDDVARTDDLYPAAPRLDQADAVGDVQGLAPGMRVPRGAGARCEAHRVDPGRLAAGDDVEPDVTGEPLGRTLRGRLLRQELHRTSLLVRMLGTDAGIHPRKPHPA